MAYPIDPGIANAIRNQQPKPVVPRPAAPAVNPLGGILTDPSVVQAGLARQQTIQDANAALRQQRSQALIGYGSPDLARSLGDTVDPNTASAAGANQYSVLANLLHQQQTGRRGILNSLAGRGLLASGDLGFQEGELARGYGQASYDALNNLLGQLSGYLGTNVGAQQTANDGYLQALLASFARMGQNPLGSL